MSTIDMTSKSKITLCIEGNVGVGKSTFLAFLQKHLDVDLLFEPNELWQDVDGYNLLEQFFLNPTRWAYSFQSYILCTRVDQLLQEYHALSDKVCVVERSIYSGRYCFAQVAREIGIMDGLEWSLYCKLWDREEARVARLPDGFVYLRTPASICYNRISHRGRFEEKPITLDYLKRIEQKYEDWFMHKTGIDSVLGAVPTLVLDLSGDLTVDIDMQEHYLKQVTDFLKDIQG